MRAFCALKAEPHYRHQAFMAGLAAIGCSVKPGRPGRPDLCDVLVIWNRYDADHIQACAVEKAGGIVLVAENGYLGVDREDRQRYAIARSFHNGRGDWFPGGPERWESLGIELQTIRHRGEYVLVCPNRSFGTPGGIMHPDWAQKAAAHYGKGVPVIVRPHPGNVRPTVPLEEHLARALAVVIWSSSVGVAALVEGIPVLCEAPWWICKAAAGADDGRDERRLPALRAMAWAQWTVDEIAAGAPFRHLLARELADA